MALASRDVQLDSVALVQAHLSGDSQAADVVLGNCDLLPTANFLAWLIAGMLRGLAERDNLDPASLIKGVDELRAQVLQDGDDV
jgi:hypothetical protein